MNLSIEIAKRYLFGKKSTNAINLITGISVLGISIGTAALVLILSVFNGFESLITQFLDNFNPDVKVEPVRNKYFSLSDQDVISIEEIPGIQGISKTLEEVVIFEYKGTTRTGIIKGVDQNFTEVIDIESALIKGDFDVDNDKIAQTVVGSVIARELGMSVQDRLTPLTMYFPKRKKSILGKEFSDKDFYLKGIFSVQNESDSKYAFASLDRVQQLLDKKGKMSSIEIKFVPDADEDQVFKEVRGVLGEDFLVKNRFEQDSTYLKIMNIEKWMSFLIVSLTIIIIAFNMIGCLWMIILDKKKDIATLKSMGAQDNDVKNIFLYVGILITILGVGIGFLIALALYYAQVHFGLITMAEGFVIDTYPIGLRLSDFVIVFLTVFTIGVIASIGPSIKAKNIPAFIREE